MKKIILERAPVFIQNLAITIYNTWLYKRRHSGKYALYRRYFSAYDGASEYEISQERDRRLRDFLTFARCNSPYYSAVDGERLEHFPILDKTTIVNRLGEMSTLPERAASVSLTGGTTGASMKVLYTKEDVQERSALLDHFRSKYGHSLGRRTAWFSGKDLTRDKDLRKGICYRDDWLNRIRFFSTFHLNDRNFESYWSAFIEFSPEYIVGFPSTVYALCAFAAQRGLEFRGAVKAFFPTAETVLPHHRELIGRVLGCPLIDQYASSEGAPFILQCRHGRLHIHPLTGVFEVVDQSMRSAIEGEILVTSFTTRGTPLIRYKIGDRIKLAPAAFRCSCGSSHPVVDYIDGRSSDFVWSPDNGRVNLGNISNCTKDAPGIICFQIIQDDPFDITVKIVPGATFSEIDEAKFLNALRTRLGDSMSIVVAQVGHIPTEKSGKFKLVKNSLSSSNAAIAPF